MPKPVSMLDALAAARVYDANGAPSVCGAPRKDCPAEPVMQREFVDQCRLDGFRVLVCGCELRCTGDVVSARRHYDPDGQPKDCVPARTDCTPTPPSAAFQDACAEHGFRLDTCGCETLCSGDFKHGG